MDAIVVGVDGTEDSLHALGEAARLGQEAGVGLVVVCVRHEGTMAPAAAGPASREALDAMEKSVYEQAGRVLADRTVHWAFDVRSGDPAAELIKAAREHHARAIVVGGRSHGIVGGIVTGSVAQKLVRQSPVSVLVVRDDGTRHHEAVTEP
jgi:nucleotide-binding universal stress UspA family protein